MADKNSKKQKILILGGGFGGIKAALELADHPGFHVTLLSDQENFRYYPSLYRAATGAHHSSASIPLNEIFKGKAVKLVKDKAKKLDKSSKKVTGAAGKTYSYDILIIALGVVTNYFGIAGLRENSFGIKTLEEARELRDHLHSQLVTEQKPDVNYIIIGGGATGVELAGELPGYIRHIMGSHGLKGKVNVRLVEAAPRLMPRMPKSYSKAVARRLRRLGIKLQMGDTVQAETASALMVDGKPVLSHTVTWTAGVTNHPFLKDSGLALNPHGKATVDQYLQAEQDIYVIGDNADTMYSGMAQTALYDGSFVASNLKRRAAGQATVAYKAKKPIYVTPVGPGWAAVLWGKVQIYGWLGWVLRNAADLAGYRDYEPWWEASQHLMAGYRSEESCPVCKTR